MTGPLTTRHRTAAETARALGALAVLVLLVAGIPAALLIVAPSGVDVTDLPSLLMRPDDGTLFLAALAGIAWLAWAVFALSVVVETVALVRGMPTPRLPGLATPQRSAAVLVGAAAVLLTSNPWQTVAPTVQPVVATAPATAREPTSTAAPNFVTPKPKPAAEVTAGPTVTVRRGDTLWALADRHFGAGTRYRDIAELNYDREQPDGRTLTRDHWIYPGWTLRLPADASSVRDDEPDTYVVQKGDTLSEIAADHLGDADRYPDIARATRPVEQPNGAHLSDPDVILPGWTLRLPEMKATSERKPPLRNETPKPKDDDATRATPSFPAPVTPAPTVRPTEAATPSPPSSIAATPSAAALNGTNRETTSPTSIPIVAEAPDEADDELNFPSRLVLGLGGLASAGFIGHLALRRRRQQRVRGPGQRIPMPEPAEAAVEQVLRAAQEPFTAADIRRALRALARQCRESSRDLPRLLHLRVTPESVYLTFAEEEPDPPTGFLAAGPRTWRIGDVHRRTDPESLTEVDPDLFAFDPYPALVTLGVTGDDALLMVNLEAAGSFTVAGEPDQTRAILLALIAELSTSTLSENAGLTLTESLSGLAEVHDLTRVQATTEFQLGVIAGRHRQEVVDVLMRAPAVDVHYARSHGIAEDVWAPEIYASDDAVPYVEPWLGTVILGADTSPGPGWTLALDDQGLARLDPLDLLVEPQRLPDEIYEHLLTLLSTANASPVPSVPVQVTPASAAEVSPAAVPALTPAVDPAPVPRPLAASDPKLDHPSPVAPGVLVLGPVVVEGADDESIPHRRRRATELVAYLALHSGATTHQIDEAIWPGRRIGKQTRNSFVSRARHWLGRSPDGDPYLPLVATDGDYRLSTAVTCDWRDFQRLAAEGMAAGVDGVSQLEAALSLVRGRPFLGVDPTTYTWAEADIQEMISAIVDAAHALAQIRATDGDHQAAQRAAAQGLLAEPCSDLLFSDSIDAAASRGDVDEVIRLKERRHIQVDALEEDR